MAQAPSAAPQAAAQKPRHKGEARRRHCVSVRLNTAELAKVQAWTGGATRRKKLGQVLRDAALGRGAVVVPQVNQTRWEELARTLSNLNQIAYHLNSGRIPEDVRPLLRDLLKEVRDLRAELHGKEPSDDS
jgi:hypothetical protein